MPQFVLGFLLLYFFAFKLPLVSSRGLCVSRR